MPNSILFVDSGVSNYETMLVGLASDMEIHLLNDQANGVLQMAAVLKNRADLDSIHIVSHGSSGALPLGSISLNNNNLADYADALKQIGSSLTATGDILLYGCDVAQGTEGIDFINKLAEITGADVAASTHLTGNAALGGDWVLEANTGAIEATVLQVIDYKDILATLTATTGIDNLVGSTVADTINVAVDTIQSGDMFNGGTGTDTIKLSTITGGTYDFTVLGTENLLGIEKLTFGNNAGTAPATAIFNANQFSANGLSNSLAITGVSNTCVQAIVINNASNFTATGWTFTSFPGTTNPDTITLNGTVNNDSIIGSSVADTITGGAGDDTLTAGSGDDSIDGGAGNDLITGDLGADTLTGGGGVDSFTFAAWDTTLIIGGAGTNGTLTGNDVITDFRLGETLRFSSAAIATSITGTMASSLLLNTGVAVKSHSITTGIITFDDANTFVSAVSLTTAGDIAAVTQYLQSHNLGATGATVVFTATIATVPHTYIYRQGTTAGVTNSADILVDVQNIPIADITVVANQISLFTPPAITFIAENSSGGINATEASDGTPVVVNLTNTGAMAGDTLTINWGSQSIAYTVQASDISRNSATVTIPLATITNQGDGTFNVSAKITDAILNASVASTPFSVTVDTTAPTVPTDSDAATNAVAEDASNATAVGLTVHSTDANGVAYLLSDNAGGRFAINTATGVVTVADGNSLNYEANTSHAVTAVATDQAGNSASQTFTIGITNVDEVAPSFTSGDIATAIDENSGAGQVVYTATSTDTMDYVSGTTAYRLKAGDDAASFSMNVTTGAVTLTGNPNYEIKNSYGFTVVATDAAGNFAEKAVALAITDLNEAMSYSATTFSEAAVNDGSIPATSTITLTNETFAKNVGDALGSVTNVPAGLTARLVKTSANTATLSFTGKAIAHENSNDINNLTVSFGNADFSGGSTVGITDAKKSNLVIDFADPLPVVVSPVTPVNHAPTGTVTISGTTDVGQVLTAVNTLADTDGLGTIAYQWKENGTIITVNSKTYILTTADVGKMITVTASYTDGIGTAESVSSVETAAVTVAPVVVPPMVTPTPAFTPVPISTPTPAPTPAPAPVIVPPVYDNPSPAPIVPVILSTFTVDGVTVRQNFTDVNGANVGHFSTPPVLATRIEDYSTAHPKAADIPLGTVNKNAGVALALPTGVGFQADGVTGQQYLYTAFNQLSDDIKTVLDANSPAVADGQRFLLKFTSLDQPFFEQKIALSHDNKTYTNQPVIIDGTHITLIPVLNTFVIDASALPKGSTLELKHVDFATIKGEVSVKLDATANVVHLGSTETQQSVFTGAGDDVVQVDNGSRLIHGGLGTDTVQVAGKLADYQVKQDVAKITLTSLSNSADVQTLVNVEKVQFVDQMVTFHYDSQINAIVATYQQMFGRQADLAGEQFWADAIKNKGLSLGQMAVEFMHSDEQLQKIGFDISKADSSTQVEQFYQSFLGRAFDPVGKAFWVDKLTSGALNLTDLAATMIQSVEMQNHYATPAQWDFTL